MTQTDSDSHGKNALKTIFDFSGVLIVGFVLALIVGNIIVIFVADVYNQEACWRAAHAVANGVKNGLSTRSIYRSAQDSILSLTVLNTYMDGPECTECFEQPSMPGNVWQVTTVTSIRLPAPFLVLNNQHALEDGRLKLTKTYLLKIGRV